MDPICKNCRHWRVAGQLYNEKTGNFEPESYCHASRNFAKRGPNDMCKRYHYNPDLALKQ